MKNKKLFYGIAMLFLISLFVFIERPVKSIKLPPQISGKCDIENCHGLDITCGPNIPEACDLMYVSGDGCRQYASCETINGKCQLVKNAKFDTCKSCVEKCSEKFKDDIGKALPCESRCRE